MPSTAADRIRGERARPPVFLAERAQLKSDQIVLSGAEGRHAATVRRLTAGEQADVTDGAGTVAECVVTRARAGTVELAVRARRADAAPDPRIVVVQAIPKGDRGEQAVEIMTEVGADVLVPWRAERCVARWGDGDRAGRALARWRATAREAAKQSRRTWFPEVTGPETTEAVAARCGRAALAILLDPDAGIALADLGLARSGDIVVIVGPEGGVSPAEAASVGGAGAIAARLGPGTLRTSSAGAVAAALVLSRCGRW
jgi:16S rRNA (uracil1498-N3)-methyltransferase